VQPCIKVLGADFELANAIEIEGARRGEVTQAAKRLLEEIRGYPEREYWGGTAIEWGRRFLPGNGGSAYIDSDHLEMNLPEHTRAADHAAHVHAALRIAHEAQVAASAKLSEGRLNVTAAVSDARQSWGHHLNVMVRREMFDDMFYRKPHLALWLATHLATATLYTGQGKVGSGNKRGECDYQLSQRADYFEELVGLQTTHSRPLLNVRDEPHAKNPYARMHIIYFDRVLCPTANYLMAGATQLVLAMAEAGWIDLNLLLDDPLSAAHEISRDMTLRRKLPMAQRGLSMSAVEIQRELATRAAEFVASGEAEPAVAGAADIVRVWVETLDMVAKRDLPALMRRCDWALKYLLLERHRGRQGLTWDSAEMKSLDFRYSSLDPEEGLFLQMAAAGVIENMPDAATIDRFYREPPDDTRAYLRAHVLRRFGDQISTLDWESVRFRLHTDRYWWQHIVMDMNDPLAWTREQSEPVLAKCATVSELVSEVGEEKPTWGESTWRSGGWGRSSGELVGWYQSGD